MFDDGVLLQFGERESAVLAVSQTFAASGAGERDELRVFAETCRVVEIDKAASGKHHVADRLLKQRDRFLFPVNQIDTFEVSPVHVAPGDSERIVLVVKMVFSVVKDHSVGVVVPTAARRGMKLVAIRLGIVVFAQSVRRGADLDLVESRFHFRT